MLGNNYRMTDISASMGLIQLKKLNSCLKKKNEVAKIYNKHLTNNKNIKIPYIPNYVTRHSWYNYSIKVPSQKRDKLINFLSKKGIETRLSFPPVHIQPYYKKKFITKTKDLINGHNVFKKFLDIPIWPYLSKKKQLYVTKMIIKFLS